MKNLSLSTDSKMNKFLLQIIRLTAFFSFALTIHSIYSLKIKLILCSLVTFGLAALVITKVFEMEVFSLSTNSNSEEKD